MKVVFFGSSSFALPSLKALLDSGIDISAVVSAPDAKKGRGLKVSFNPIKAYASSLSMIVLQPDSMSDENFINRLKSIGADIFVVVAYGHILTKEILDMPKIMPINLHASFLPKYRGPAPINWALINGEKASGVSVIKMDEFIDTGDIILQDEVAINSGDNAITFGAKLAERGSDILLSALKLAESGKVQLKKQKEADATLAPRLSKSTGEIDWQMSALELHNRVRGLLPWPCAFTHIGQKLFRIIKSSAIEGKNETAAAGAIFSIDKTEGIIVQTGSGKLALKEVQLEGGKSMSAADFTRGHKLKIGHRFGVVV